MSETDDSGALLEIENEFRRRLAGLRGIPRRDRSAAFRLAKDWFRQAMVELREKRLRERHAAIRLKLRNAKRPAPGGTRQNRTFWLG